MALFSRIQRAGSFRLKAKGWKVLFLLVASFVGFCNAPTSSANASDVSLLIDHLTSDRPIVGKEVFSIDIPAGEDERVVEVILISAGQEITLASYWIDGSRGKLLLDGEGVLGPDPGRLPPGEIVTRLIDSQQAITELSQTIQWENSPWYPNGDSTVQILDRVGRKLRDGKPAIAYRELKSVSKEGMDVDQLAEWHRLNASVLDVFSKIDRVHIQPSKQQLARAFEISNESSSVRIRSLIDRAERRLREGRISQDPEVRRDESNGALKDARSALNLALKKGDRRLASMSLVEIARASAERGWKSNTLAAIESARDLNGDSDTNWRTELALARLHEVSGDRDKAIDSARSAVAVVESMRWGYSEDSSAMFKRRGPALFLAELLAKSGKVVESLAACESLRMRRPGEIALDVLQINRIAKSVGDQFSIQVVLDTGRHLLSWKTRNGEWVVDVTDHENGELVGHINNLHRTRGKAITSARWISKRVFDDIPPSGDRFLLIPVGDLRRVPWSMLPVDGRSLLDHCSWSMLPNLRAAKRELSSLPSRKWLSLVDPEAIDRPRLPGALEEGKLVSRSIPESKVISGSAANVESLIAEVGNAQVLHLACHGDFDPRAPLESKLFLSPSVESESGEFKARELAHLPLANCRLILLTGCETALASAVGADDLAGFTGAAFDAGCDGFLGSLWPVEDAVTREVIGEIIAAAKDQKMASEALRDACRSIKRQFGNDQVSAWSGWVLVENGR
ncbi:MAG: CHAT domain-containing protein [Planctomycetia bacterium]|nr:CHAT domain-containing protein [Planctomycetia bacterium]MBL6914055.1 CHAT domain-containing protein [Planctomycetota bacterium]